MQRLLLLFPLILSFACTNTSASGSHDAGTHDAGPRCGVPAPPTCTVAATVGQTFPIDAAGQYEIASSSAYDGTLWVAYSRGDTSGVTHNFQVWLTRFGCDGSVLLAPTQVSTDTANDVNPVITVSDGVVLVAWISDSSLDPNAQPSTNNLTLKYRLYGAADAAALTPAELTLRTTRDGSPVDANMLDPSVAALPGGGFVLAATRSSADQTSFQAFVQKLDAAGGLVDQTIDPGLDSESTHDNAAVSAGPDGTIFAAWAREEKTGSNTLPLLHTSIPPGSVTPREPSEGYLDVAGTYSTMTGGIASCSRSYIAFQAPLSGQQEVMIADAAVTAVTTPGLEIFVPGTVAVGPHVAQSDDGGAVAWLAESASTDHTILVQRFTYDGTNWQVHKRVQIPPMGKIAIRPPSIAHVSGNTYFVTWVEGSGATTITYGRLVALDD